MNITMITQMSVLPRQFSIEVWIEKDGWGRTIHNRIIFIYLENKYELKNYPFIQKSSLRISCYVFTFIKTN